MSFSTRSAITVLAALAASSVAPAQVTQDAEPLIAAGSGVLPVPAVIKTIEDEVGTPDPLAPLSESDVDQPDQDRASARPAQALASLVAQYRSSDPASHELECL